MAEKANSIAFRRSSNFDVKVSLHGVFNIHTDFTQTTVRLVTIMSAFFSLNKHLPKTRCTGRFRLATFPPSVFAGRACIHGSKGFKRTLIRSQGNAASIKSIKFGCNVLETWTEVANEELEVNPTPHTCVPWCAR
jgi:hypothetical protein